jgi:hypothetical protein
MWGGHQLYLQSLVLRDGVREPNHWGLCDASPGILSDQRNRRIGFKQFCTLFGALVQETLTMSEVLLHGDALPHNIMYDDLGLTLIDLDEGVAEGRAPTRDCDPDIVFPYLRYPNYLPSFEDRRSYTSLQLVASFLLYVEDFFQSPQRQQQLQDLVRSADGLDWALGTHDSNDPDGYSANLEMQSQVERTIALFEGVLTAEKMKV